MVNSVVLCVSRSLLVFGNLRLIMQQSSYVCNKVTMVVQQAHNSCASMAFWLCTKVSMVVHQVQISYATRSVGLCIKVIMIV